LKKLRINGFTATGGGVTALMTLFGEYIKITESVDEATAKIAESTEAWITAFKSIKQLTPYELWTEYKNSIDAVGESSDDVTETEITNIWEAYDARVDATEAEEQLLIDAIADRKERLDQEADEARERFEDELASYQQIKSSMKAITDFVKGDMASAYESIGKIISDIGMQSGQIELVIVGETLSVIGTLASKVQNFSMTSITE